MVSRLSLKQFIMIRFEDILTNRTTCFLTRTTMPVLNTKNNTIMMSRFQVHVQANYIYNIYSSQNVPSLMHSSFYLVRKQHFHWFLAATHAKSLQSKSLANPSASNYDSILVYYFKVFNF